ncbi:unnamed protein product [Prunus armeniaca]
MALIASLRSISLAVVAGGSVSASPSPPFCGASFHAPRAARVPGGLFLGFPSNSTLASNVFSCCFSAFRRFMLFWLGVPGVEVPFIFRLNMLVVK